MSTYAIKKQEDEWKHVIQADIENKKIIEQQKDEIRRAKFTAY